jgi:hypothetical protein
MLPEPTAVADRRLLSGVTRAADRLAGRLRYASVQAVDTAAWAWARGIDSGWRSLSDSRGSAVVRAEQAAGSNTESAQIAAIREALCKTPDQAETSPAQARSSRQAPTA